MPTNNWQLLRGYAAVALTYATFLALDGGDERSARTAFLVVTGAALALSWVALRWLKERHLRTLRRQAREARRRLVSSILDDAYREELTSQLAEDDAANASTDYVEAFVFPGALRRQTLRLLAIAWSSAIVFLSLAFVGGWGTRWRDTAPLFAGGAALAAAGVLSNRLRHLGSVLEVTRFGLAEVKGEARVLIPWSRALLLRHRPLLRRFELSALGARQRIRIDYSRLEFFRLLEAVLELGRFGAP